MFHKRIFTILISLLLFTSPFATPALAQANLDADALGLPSESRIQDSKRSPIVEGSGGLTEKEVQALQTQGQQQLHIQPRSMTGASHCTPVPFNPYRVCGAIGQRYNKLGGVASWLLWPVGNETVNPDGVGVRQQFRNGFIYWHPKTGAHAVSTRVAAAWAEHGWEQGPMGYPLGGEVTTSGTDPLSGDLLDGWKQHFQGGMVFRSPVTFGGPAEGAGQHVGVVWGSILERYNQLDGPSSSLGFPVTDELVAPDGIGRYQHFQDGVIAWHPTHGSWEVFGLVNLIWQARGGFESQWTYPIAAPKLEGGTPTSQEFAGGALDMWELVDQAGTEMLGKKEVSSLMIEVLAHLGVQAAADDEAEPMHTTRSAGLTACRLLDSSGIEFGGVTIPSTYISWACHPPYLLKQYSESGRHDYCTLSPDNFQLHGKISRLHGACARHDMCMDRVDITTPNGTRQKYLSCNRELRNDIERICGARHPKGTKHYRNCAQVAKFYHHMTDKFAGR